MTTIAKIVWLIVFSVGTGPQVPDMILGGSKLENCKPIVEFYTIVNRVPQIDKDTVAIAVFFPDSVRMSNFIKSYEMHNACAMKHDSATGKWAYYGVYQYMRVDSAGYAFFDYQLQKEFPK